MFLLKILLTSFLSFKDFNVSFAILNVLLWKRHVVSSVHKPACYRLSQATCRSIGKRLVSNVN